LQKELEGQKKEQDEKIQEFVV